MVKIKIKNYTYYPELTDNKFQEKIYNKKEFYEHRIPKETRKMEEICKPTEFDLFPQQKLLKNYLSINTPYNGILIFHGVGVGKTCAAISIAENFVNLVKRYKKKILILSSHSLRENFIKTIYNIDKENLKKSSDDVTQCTGNKYMLTDDDKFLTREQKIRKIKRNISKSYQFMGYGRFANEVKRKTGWNGRKADLTNEMIKIIKKEYSNRVIIIDEIHNIKKKSNSSDNDRQVAFILTTVITIAENLKLILMSATPMYDKPKEIIFILNLLLLNDNREPIDYTKIFDKNGFIKPEGEKILEEYSNGYVSYLRGENPTTFPLKIFSQQSKVLNYKYDINGNPILQKLQIEYTRMIDCPMTKYQYELYKEVDSERKIVIEEINLNNDDYENDLDKIEINNIKSNVFTKLIQISNIVFPLKNGGFIDGIRGFSDSDNGLGAFYIDKKKGKKTIQFKYQNHVLMNRGTKNEKPFIDKKYLGDYSSKFAKIIKFITKSSGPVIIYSRYIRGGILPFALALEQNGIQRYLSGNEQPLLNYSFNKKKGGGISEPIYYKNGTPLSKFKSVSKFKPMKYAILFPDQEFVKTTPSRIAEIINKKNNIYGSELKIILGTRVISEGIDFKNIRQIHIIDPWYNLSVNEQIAGRGIRNCSHVNLPKEERNVELYQYVSTLPKKLNKESVDIKNYRLSETKDKQIKKVERILKRTAFDCLLNKNANILVKNKKETITTSLGEKIKLINGLQPYSRECDYVKDCSYSCLSNDIKSKKDTSTYAIDFAIDDIKNAKKIIKRMYKYNYAYTIDQIRSKINNKIPSLQDLYIFIAIDELLKSKKEVIQDKYDREGYLIYKGDYYIFQPGDINYNKIPMYYRETPLTYKVEKIDITEHISRQEQYNQNNDKVIKNITQIINTQYDKLLKNNFNFLKSTFSENNYKLLIIEYIIGRLSSNQFIFLINNLFNSKEANIKFEKEIYTILKKNIIKINNINAIIIDKKYYCFTNKKIKKCRIEDKKNIIKNMKKKKNIENSKLYGIIINKKLKIIDLRKYTGARTLNKKISKRSEITGRMCLTYSINEIYEIVKYLKLKNIKKKKKNMCFGIEIMLRHFENNDNKLRHFYKNF